MSKGYITKNKREKKGCNTNCVYLTSLTGYCCFLGHFVGLNHRLVCGSSFVDYAKRLVHLFSGCSFFLYCRCSALRGFLAISYFFVSIFSHSEFFSFIKMQVLGFLKADWPNKWEIPNIWDIGYFYFTLKNKWNWNNLL